MNIRRLFSGRWTLFVAVAATCLTSPLGAQTTTGSVRGYVRDPAGSPIADAQVIARIAALGFTRATTTNTNGYYNLAGLRPARYEIQVRRLGFTAQTRTLDVGIGQTLTFDVQLQAATTQIAGVVVTAEATEGARTSEVGTNVSRTQIENLPNFERNFLDIADANDRLVVTHSFSKSFLMTGWRLGWLVLPSGLSADVAKLIEFNTSCAPVFVQRAGLAAVREADASVPGLVERLRICRDTLIPRLAALPNVLVAQPRGGMYAFFRVEGQDDSLVFAKRLVEDVGLGLAPGVAFGPEAEGWLRWCFASRDPLRLVEGVGRLSRALGL